MTNPGSTTEQNLPDQLVNMHGLAGLSGPSAELADQLGATDSLLVSPTTAESLAATLAIAAGCSASVIPIGAGTKQSRGNRPSSADLLVSTAKLNRVIDHQPADLTVSVQAGLPLSLLQTQLAESGQFLPFDPPWARQATLGGLMATAAEGPLRRRYGALRDHLLGARIAQPDGTIATAGGRVVKNVSGYDLTRLHTGAFGTLGVVTEMNFKVWPLPQAEATVLLLLSDPIAALARLSGAQFWPMAADLYLGSAVRRVQPGADGDEAWLALRFGGREAAVQRSLNDANELFGTGQVLDESDSKAFWQRSAGLQEGFEAGESAVAAIALPALPRIALMQAARERWRGGDFDFACWGRTEHGLAYLALTGPAETADAVFAELRWLRDQALRQGGSCVFEHLPAHLRDSLDPWGPPDPVALRVMNALKRALDPTGTLNPGRYLGGI